MTKTAIREFIRKEQFDEEEEMMIWRALGKYPQEELSAEEMRDFLMAIDNLKQETESDLAAVNEETQILNEAWAEIDQIEDDAANQIAAVYQDGINQVGQMAKEAQGQLQQQ